MMVSGDIPKDGLPIYQICGLTVRVNSALCMPWSKCVGTKRVTQTFSRYFATGNVNGMLERILETVIVYICR